MILLETLAHVIFSLSTARANIDDRSILVSHPIVDVSAQVLFASYSYFQPRFRKACLLMTRARVPPNNPILIRNIPSDGIIATTIQPFHQFVRLLNWPDMQQTIYRLSQHDFLNSVLSSFFRSVPFAGAGNIELETTSFLQSFYKELKHHKERTVHRLSTIGVGLTSDSEIALFSQEDLSGHCRMIRFVKS